MRLRNLEGWGGAITALFLAVIFWLLFTGWRDCKSEGGKYVRGLFWMECVR